MNNKNPKYDNDLVTLGYLKKTFNSDGEEITDLSKLITKSYASPPVTPYYKGSILYYNHNIYRCKIDKLQGKFDINDWEIVGSDDSGFQQWVQNDYVLDKTNILSQVDKKIETFYQANDPSLEWTTDIVKARHEGDFWYKTTDNTEWRWSKYDTNPITYGWRHVDVSDEVYDLIDTKKSIYAEKPTTYNQDDMWIIEDDLPDADLPIGTAENPIVRGDWVFAKQDSSYYDKSHWEKRDTDITMEYITEHYYTTSEIESKIAEIGDDILEAKQEVITQVSEDIDEQNATITAISSRVDGYDSQIATIRVQYNDIVSKISDITDLTVSDETINATLSLANVNVGQPITIKIKPIAESISYIYPYDGLYPSDTLYMKDRRLRFTNTTEYMQTTDSKYESFKKYYSYANDVYTLLVAGTDYTIGNTISGTVYENKYYDWVLPTDLWYYDSNTYDELELSYGDGTNSNVIVTRKCQINSDASISVLGTPTTETYAYPSDLVLTTGDYTITLLDYTYAYLYVQLMSKTIYTAEFYTRVETNSLVEQKANQLMNNVNAKFTGYSNTTEMNNTIEQKIVDNNTNYVNIEVAKKVNNTDFTKAQIVAKINDNTSQVQIAADKVNLTGYITATNLATSGQTTINGGNITTGTISSNRLDSNVITTSNLSAQNINANQITSGTLATSRLSSDVITTSNLSAQNISASQITSGTISTSRLSSSVITTSNFSSQNINASKIISGTLNGNNVSVTNLSASNIKSGSLTSTNVKIGSWKLNSSGIYGDYVELFPSSRGFGYKNSSGGWAGVSWEGIGRAGTAYSDKNLKKNIKSLDERFNGFFDDLKPISFKWKSTKYKTDDKEHIGFIAQDIQEAEKNNDIDLDIVYETDKVLNLDKRELIALNTWQIQMLKKENKELKGLINELKEEIQEIKKGK